MVRIKFYYRSNKKTTAKMVKYQDQEKSNIIPILNLILRNTKTIQTRKR